LCSPHKACTTKWLASFKSSLLLKNYLQRTHYKSIKFEIIYKSNQDQAKKLCFV
jgi:hypothetical protein